MGIAMHAFTITKHKQHKKNYTPFARLASTISNKTEQYFPKKCAKLHEKFVI